MTHHENQPSNEDISALHEAEFEPDHELEALRAQIELKLAKLTECAAEVDYYSGYPIVNGNTQEAELWVEYDKRGERQVTLWCYGDGDTKFTKFDLVQGVGATGKLIIGDAKFIKIFVEDDQTDYPAGFKEFVELIDLQSDEEGDTRVEIGDEQFDELFDNLLTGATDRAPLMYRMGEDYVLSSGDKVAIRASSDTPKEGEALPVHDKKHMYVEVESTEFLYIARVEYGKLSEEFATKSHDPKPVDPREIVMRARDGARLTSQEVTDEQLWRVNEALDLCITIAGNKLLEAPMQEGDLADAKIASLMKRHPQAFELIDETGKMNDEKEARWKLNYPRPDDTPGDRNAAHLERHSIASKEIFIMGMLKLNMLLPPDRTEKMRTVGRVLTNLGEGRRALIDLINDALPGPAVSPGEYIEAALLSLEKEESSRYKKERVENTLNIIAEYFGVDLENIRAVYLDLCVDGKLKFDASDEEIYRAFGIKPE